MRYHERSGWASGSGWLIDDRTVVTAAHNLYDSAGSKKEHAKNVLVAIGYSGKQTKDENTPEIQLGKSAAVHLGYYNQNPKSYDPEWQKYDIAIIRLENSFKEPNPLLFENTPYMESNVAIEVVGYPGDLPQNAPDDEKGGIMYRARERINCDLQKDKYQLLYRLDTYPGKHLAISPCRPTLLTKAFTRELRWTCLPPQTRRQKRGYRRSLPGG